MLLTACGGDSQSELSITEQARLGAPPEVGKFMIKAQQSYENGHYNYALSMTDSAEAYAPNLADIHFIRGKIYTDMNQIEIANEAFKVTLEVDPAYPGANFSQGQNSFRRGQLREALGLFEKELEIGETTGIWRETGRIYAQLNEPDSAITAYTKAIELDSTNTAAIMWLGQLQEDAGDLELALETSKKGLAVQPDNPNYRYIIGSILNRLDRPEEAKEYLLGVAIERPWHHGAQYNLAQVLTQLGETEEADVYFAKAEKAQKHQQEINEAQTEINRDPTNLENWIELADLHRKSNQLDRAADAYRRAVALVPENLALQSNLAGVILEMGDPEEAMKRYQAIAKVNPNMAEVWVNMGVCMAQLGAKDQAISAWQRALRVDPRNKAAKTFLSRADQIGS